MVAAYYFSLNEEIPSDTSRSKSRRVLIQSCRNADIILLNSLTLSI